MSAYRFRGVSIGRLLGPVALVAITAACATSTEDVATTENPTPGADASGDVGGGDGAVADGTADGKTGDAKTDVTDATPYDGPCADAPEICDGLDNNCNGQVDEGNPGGGGTCDTGKKGLCGVGTMQCASGALKCVQTNLPDVEICDGLDNDCDGVVDNGDPGGGQECDTGLKGQCKTGISHCLSGVPVCDPLIQPKTETCNGVDDDCDGTVDNQPMAGVGVACNVTGQPSNTPCGKSTSACTAGKIACPQTYFAQTETCDGADNDCNGVIDDPGAVNGQPCNTGLPGVCGVGTGSCSGGVLNCSVAVQPGTQNEICDGKDNNCDGDVDEMDPTSTCPTQLPQAGHVSGWTCSSGQCAVTACQAGFIDINSSVGDGCECSMTTYGGDCNSATALTVPFGTSSGSPITRIGGIAQDGGTAWFQVTFAKPSMGTPYHFKVELSNSANGVYGMNVRTTCTNATTCSDNGSGTGATTWEGATTYTQGLGCCSDQSPPPSQVYVEVYRTGSGTSCDKFTLTFLDY